MGAAPLATAAAPILNLGVKGYKAGGLQKARKQVTLISRLGKWERMILEYGLTVSRTFSAADILVHYFGDVQPPKRYSMLKRIHDAIKRLVKRGYVREVHVNKVETLRDGTVRKVRKRARGLYQVVTELSAVTVDLGALEELFTSWLRKLEALARRWGRRPPKYVLRRQGNAVVGSVPGGCVSGGLSGGVGGDGCVVVWRLHGVVGVGGGVELLFFVRLLLLELFVGWLRRVFGLWLLGLGVSRGLLRRLGCWVRSLFGLLVGGASVVFGVHGVWGSGRRFGCLVPASEVRGLGGVRACEFGADVVFEGVPEEVAGLLREVVRFSKVYVKSFKSLSQYLSVV